MDQWVRDRVRGRWILSITRFPVVYINDLIELHLLGCANFANSKDRGWREATFGAETISRNLCQLNPATGPRFTSESKTRSANASSQANSSPETPSTLSATSPRFTRSV